MLDLPPSINEVCARSPPYVGSSDWDGIVLATLFTEEDACLVGRMFHMWRPLIAIYAPRLGLPQTARDRWLAAAAGSEFSPNTSDSYSATLVDRPHSYFGGVTLACRTLAHYTRMSEWSTHSSIMTTSQFDRPLQTALDDTKGGRRRAKFEELPPGGTHRMGGSGAPGALKKRLGHQSMMDDTRHQTLEYSLRRRGA